MDSPGRGFLKVSGILLTIWGGIVVLSAVPMLAVISKLAGAATTANRFDGVGMRMALGGTWVALIMVLLLGGFIIFSGIAGIKNCDSPENAKICLVLGGIIMLITLFDVILSRGSGLTFILIAIVRLAIPGTYLWGAFLNNC